MESNTDTKDYKEKNDLCMALFMGSQLGKEYQDEETAERNKEAIFEFSKKIASYTRKSFKKDINEKL